MSLPLSVPGPTFILAISRPSGPATTASPLRRPRPPAADGHAALSPDAVGRAHQRVDGVGHVGVGHQHGVVLGAAQGLHALAMLAAPNNVFGDRRRADKADPPSRAVLQQRIDGGLVAVDHVEHAGRQTGFQRQLAMNRVLLGSRPEGFRTKVLPQATAMGHIHSGTMAGKLNGVMPAVTPSAWCSAQLSMPGPTLRLCSPL